MLAVIASLNLALGDFAPEYVRAPNKAMLRIYRDVRFSNDKSPYKTHLAAHVLDHHAELRCLLTTPALTRLAQPFGGNNLIRPPRGFPIDHPVADLLLNRSSSRSWIFLTYP